MACGTPVIAPSNSSLPEVIGDAGIYVENALEPKAWYDCMKRLIEDEDLRKYLSQKSVNRARIFTWEKSADLLKSIYETLSEE